MDIASLSMNIANNNITSAVSIAVLSKSLDMTEQTASAVTELIQAADMERSVRPEVGSNIDIYI